MKQLFFTLLLAAGFASTSFAQTDTTHWTKKGISNLNFSQVSLSNWAAGGESSIGLDALIAYSLDYKRDKHLWTNRLEMAYGLNYTDNNGTRKTNDKLYLSTNYGYLLKKNLYWSTFLTFQTQFGKGYNYDVSSDDFISRFMSPAYLTIGTGLTWTPKPFFTATISPAAWRGTIVMSEQLSDQGAFGVDPGDHFLTEFGANVSMEVNYEIFKNITLYSRLNLYSNYLDKPKNVDVTWDVILNMKINNWISANISTNMIYDDDQKIAQEDGTSGPRLQFKEALGIGLQFAF